MDDNFYYMYHHSRFLLLQHARSGAACAGAQLSRLVLRRPVPGRSATGYMGRHICEAVGRGGGGSGGGARSIVDSVAEKTLEGYPVYNCALSGTDGCLAAAGGGTRQGFLGCPLYVLSPFG